MFEAYVKALIKKGDMQPGSYEAPDLNTAVLALPPAETWTIREGVDLRALPVMSSDDVLREYMSVNYFTMLRDEGDFWNGPFLIPRRILDKATNWSAWLELAAYLEGYSLRPMLVFRNMPFAHEGEDVYPGDIRLSCMKGFIWTD